MARLMVSCPRQGFQFLRFGFKSTFWSLVSLWFSSSLLSLANPPLLLLLLPLASLPLSSPKPLSRSSFPPISLSCSLIFPSPPPYLLSPPPFPQPILVLVPPSFDLAPHPRSFTLAFASSKNLLDGLSGGLRVEDEQVVWRIGKEVMKWAKRQLDSLIGE